MQSRVNIPTIVPSVCYGVGQYSDIHCSLETSNDVINPHKTAWAELVIGLFLGKLMILLLLLEIKTDFSYSRIKQDLIKIITIIFIKHSAK